MKYRIKLKKLEASATSIALQKAEKEVSRELSRGEYMSPTGFIDSALLEPLIDEVLSDVRSKF